MSAIANRKAKDRAKRAKLRKRLQSSGVPEAKIAKIIEQRRADDLAARRRKDKERTRAEILANTDDSLWPDDTGYRPAPVDPLLNGPARATGITAKVARRRHTITEYQHREGK